MPVRDGAPAIELNGTVAGLMIGTPMYGGQCFDAYLAGMLDLQMACTAAGVPMAFSRIRNESLIHRARNRILADFADSHCSHLLFVDADIGFTGRDALRLVAHTTGPGRPQVVGATYPKKTREKYDPALVALPGPVKVTDGEMIEVRCLPGGFLMITRDAVLRLSGAHRDDWYWDVGDGTPRRMLDLTACYIDPETRTLWSEDYALCNRWRAIGGHVWLDPNIQLTHNGTTTFDGDPRSVWGLASAAASEPPGPAAAPDYPASPHVYWLGRDAA